MKTIISLFVLLTLSGAAVAEGNAPNAPAKPIVASLHAIRDNAQEASENASRYQWARVNREVDRVVANARKVKTVSAKRETSRNQAQSLADAVSELRAARLAHDVTGVQQAAARVVAACDTLLKAE